MIRPILRGLVVVVGVALVINAAAGQPANPVLDSVTVRNTAKKDGSTITYQGKLKLSPAGLHVMSGEKFDKVKSIEFADIVKFEPGELPGVPRDEILNQLKKEKDAVNRTRKDYEAWKNSYAAMLKKAPSSETATKRYLEFCVAMMSTKMADESADDEKWSELAESAAKEWSSFLAGFNSGWEIWPATRAGARLYVELNKYDEVARLWARMAKSAELPADLKLEAAIQEIDALFRNKEFSVAGSQAESLGKAATPGAAKDKLAIYERAARAAERGLKEDTLKPVVADIEKKIAESKDSSVRGVGYSVLGELYMLTNNPRQAMWAFLTVETVYNTDRDEVLKAMCRLVDSFKAQMDEERPKQYREKIRRYRATF